MHYVALSYSPLTLEQMMRGQSHNASSHHPIFHHHQSKNFKWYAYIQCVLLNWWVLNFIIPTTLVWRLLYCGNSPREQLTEFVSKIWNKQKCFPSAPFSSKNYCRYWVKAIKNIKWGTLLLLQNTTKSIADQNVINSFAKVQLYKTL